jgi:hypothetical protein
MTNYMTVYGRILASAKPKPKAKPKTKTKAKARTKISSREGHPKQLIRTYTSFIK